MQSARLIRGWLFVALGLLSAGVIAAEPPERKVFAHYMVCCPPYGESLAAYQKEIQEAQAAGLDGFVLNCGSWSSNPNYIRRSGLIYEAARQLGTGFKLFFSADMCCSLTPADIQDMIRTFAAHPNQFRHNERPVLSTFAGDARGKDWWLTEVLQPLRGMGLDVFFVPFFFTNPIHEAPSYELINSSYQAWWKDVIDGYFYFGAAGLPTQEYPSLLKTGENFARMMRDNGKIYMAPVSPQYWGMIQKGGRRYFEFNGGEGLAAQWHSIINQQRPDWVELVTWNDFNEASWFSPVSDVRKYTKFLNHGVGFYKSHAAMLEFSKYFIAWFKTGTQPQITEDRVFYFYRTHPKDMKSKSDKHGPVTERRGQVEDVIYVTTMLTQPAVLRVKTGRSERGFAMPAGIGFVRVPFKIGNQRFELWRDNTLLVAKQGEAVKKSLPELNFIYYSGFGTTGNRPPEIVSKLSAAPRRVRAGEPAEFFIAAEDPEKSALTYTWNFGDGLSSDGTFASHTFAARGTYLVTVDINDGANMVQATLRLRVGGKRKQPAARNRRLSFH